MSAAVIPFPLADRWRVFPHLGHPRDFTLVRGELTVEVIGDVIYPRLCERDESESTALRSTLDQVLYITSDRPWDVICDLNAAVVVALEYRRREYEPIPYTVADGVAVPAPPTLGGAA